MTPPISPLLNGFLRALLRWGAALVFCLPLRRKPHFWARACGMLVPLVLLAWAMDPLAQSHTLAQQQLSLLLLYGSFFVLFGLMIHLCVEIDWNGALYCAVWSLLTAQTAYEGWCVLEAFNAQHGFPLNMQSGWARLAQLVVGVLFYGVLSAGFTSLHMSQYLQWVVMGAIMLFALSLDVLRGKGVKLWKKK